MSFDLDWTTFSNLPTEKIARLVDEEYPKVKPLLDWLGVDKGGWLASILLEKELGEHKHFIRCENCVFKPCRSINNLRERFPDLVRIWDTHGCQACQDFSPQPDAEGLP